MTQLDEAIARYHRLLDSEPYKDMAWAEVLRERMVAANLTWGGRPVTPVLRPHIITRRQYTSMVKAAEALFSAIDRIKQLALGNPALLSRLELLPAEKMLAAVDPGYPFLVVTSLLDTQLSNGSLRFIEYNADTPTGVAYGDAVSELFFECPPVKDLRKRFPLSRLGGMKHLLDALLEAWREFGGKALPHIGILEMRAPFQNAENGELAILRDFFRSQGCPAEVLTPDQMEYRNGVLRKGDFTVDLIHRRVKAQEFLLRYDLNHPVVRAYRDRKICMVNSFRAELAHKKAIFDLLTDDTVTSSFPAAEKKAIREFIPWTRLVTQSKTIYQDQTVDLPEFIVKNRERLVLKPNDDGGDQHSVQGWQTDEAGWERALRAALRNPFVVQERVAPVVAPFPLLRYGQYEIRDMRVDLHPHAFLGKVQGCSSWVSAVGGGSFSSLAGMAPTFILETMK